MLKIITLKLGNSSNIHPVSVVDMSFDESCLDRNFLYSGLIIQSEENLENAKKIKS